MGPVLFLLLFVAVTAFFAMRGRAKRTGETDQRRTVLEALAPLIDGTVSKDNVLAGRYKEYAVSAETGMSGTPGALSAPSGSGVQVVERERFDDPTPEQFRQLLDAALGIIEVNRRINP